MDNDRWSSLKVGDGIALLRPDGLRDPEDVGVIVGRHGDDPTFVVERDNGHGCFTFGFPDEFIEI